MFIYPIPEIKLAPFLSGTSTTGGVGGFASGGGFALPYDFTTYTFEDNVASFEGPTFSTLQTRYAGQPFMDGGWLVQGAYQGYHLLTLPKTGVYEFEAAGAPGTKPTYASNAGLKGGRGAIVKGRMSFTQGDKIQFTIGKSGQAEGYNGGGGGGTFVVKEAFFDGTQNDSQIVIISGGGAGGSYQTTTNDQSYRDATTGTSGNDGGGTNGGTAGNNGNGGNGRGLGGSNGAANPGAGLYSGPSNADYDALQVAATGWVSGAQGGKGYYVGPTAGVGHFSGFGGAGGGGNHAGGTGGGYNGGGGGETNGFSSGGGGSYTANLTNVVNVGYREPDAVSGFTEEAPNGGYLKITFIA